MVGLPLKSKTAVNRKMLNSTPSPIFASVGIGIGIVGTSNRSTSPNNAARLPENFSRSSRRIRHGAALSEGHQNNPLGFPARLLYVSVSSLIRRPQRSMSAEESLAREARGDFISSPDLSCSDVTSVPPGAFKGTTAPISGAIQPVALRRSPRGRPRTLVRQPLCLARLLHRLSVIRYIWSSRKSGGRSRTRRGRESRPARAQSFDGQVIRHRERTMYRQGDVLIVPVDSVPGTLDPIERKGAA